MSLSPSLAHSPFAQHTSPSSIDLVSGAAAAYKVAQRFQKGGKKEERPSNSDDRNSRRGRNGLVEVARKSRRVAKWVGMGGSSALERLRSEEELGEKCRNAGAMVAID